MFKRKTKQTKKNEKKKRNERKTDKKCVSKKMPKRNFYYAATATISEVEVEAQEKCAVCEFYSF